MRTDPVRLVLLIAAVSFPALAASPRADAGTPAPVLARLQRTMCFGWCPAYTVTIREDGTVEYDGREYVKVKGHREAKLDAKQLEALRAAFAEARFFQLTDTFDCYEATDSHYATVTYRSGGKERAIRHYYGCLSAPKTMQHLEARIDQIVGIEKWIGTEAERRELARRPRVVEP